jgi:tetratricopeptide (TPR) repeat protein
MVFKNSNTLFLFTFLISLSFFNCNSDISDKNSITKKETSKYLNHGDSANYVGMNTCKLCHQSIYNSFIKTGMGKSFDLASKSKSSADFSKPGIYDKIADLHYKAYWNKDSLYIHEFRIQKNETLYSRKEQVNFIIGSGQHTNSHLQINNGYLNQMPMTYYTQKKKWDLPPGFENGINTRFTRKIGLECISCHNAYPNLIIGSENKYQSMPSGIDCERCHGPGSIHVKQRQNGSKIDTSKYIDYSIVNPAKLSIDEQFDVCQRCHLQGNAILKENKSFFDFKPGQKLSNYISVFLPKYTNSNTEFIMASHADRLKQSPCFIKSYEKIQNKNILKPYKEAMTCVTCHNPHVSVRETNANVFNDACLSCHISKTENENTKLKLQNAHKLFKKNTWSNCVSCHMPVSGSSDIPHVTVHDHYIRKPITAEEKNKIKTFIGLFAINEKKPDSLTIAKAYINQYDKFDTKNNYLDSALNYLSNSKEFEKNRYALIQLYFIRNDFNTIITCVNKLGEARCLNELFIKKSYDNADAWACYRIAESYYYKNQITKALIWFKRAIELAPYHLDFRNKYGTTLASTNQLSEAETQFNFILKENRKYVSAYSNLGYLKLLQGKESDALLLYKKGESIDPDNELLLLNLSAYYLYKHENKIAKKYLQHLHKLYPKNEKVNVALNKL